MTGPMTNKILWQSKNKWFMVTSYWLWATGFLGAGWALIILGSFVPATRPFVVVPMFLVWIVAMVFLVKDLISDV
jgi:CHASE2 domain-containing sensor protein